MPVEAWILDGVGVRGTIGWAGVTGMAPEGFGSSNALLACVKGGGGVSPNGYCADVSSVSSRTSSNKLVGGVLVVSSRTVSAVSQWVDCGC